MKRATAAFADLAAFAAAVPGFAPPSSPPSPVAVPSDAARCVAGQAAQDKRARKAARRLGLAAAVLALAACAPVDHALLAADPSVPPLTVCHPGASVCVGASPAVCNAAGDRLWPALPPHGDGTPSVCAHGCAVTDGVARCVAADGGAR